MKRTILLFSASLALAACHYKRAPKRMAIRAIAEKQPKVKAVANAKVEMKIEGMMCVGCARTIAQKLNESPGIAHAVVDFKAKEATVAYDSAQTDTLTLSQVVAAAGPYKVGGVTRL